MAPVKAHYSRLPAHDDGFMAKESARLENALARPACNSRTSILHWTLFAIVVLQAAVIVIQNTPWPSSRGRFETGLDLPYDSDRVADTPTRFFSPNETLMSSSWDSIQPGHGIVALDPSWARSRNLPRTMQSPTNPEKVIYVVSAYHSLHCLRWLRQNYLALSRGDPVAWSWDHDLHCFDSLRQQLMCHADDTLLYTTGRRDVGHGQLRRCKNWDALRDWATERSGCYDDDRDLPARERWGKCDGGDDGLPVASLLE